MPRCGREGFDPAQWRGSDRWLDFLPGIEPDEKKGQVGASIILLVLISIARIGGFITRRH